MPNNYVCSVKYLRCKGNHVFSRSTRSATVAKRIIVEFAFGPCPRCDPTVRCPVCNRALGREEESCCDCQQYTKTTRRDCWTPQDEIDHDAPTYYFNIDLGAS
jgi:hypothetical protein